MYFLLFHPGQTASRSHESSIILPCDMACQQVRISSKKHKRVCLYYIAIDFAGYIALLLGKPFFVGYPSPESLVTGGLYCTVLQEAHQTFCRKSRVTGII